MQAKATNGFTTAQVTRAFQGLDLPVETRVRAELLDTDNTKLFDLNASELTGSITHNTDQPIKRGAELQFKEIARNSQHSAPLGTFISTIAAQNRLFHLRFNESSGNYADYTGNGRTFTASGTPAYHIDSLVSGDLTDSAVGFNGDDFATIADAAWMDVSFITLAISYRGTTVNSCLFDRDDDATHKHFRLEIDANGAVAFTINFTTGSITTYTTTATIHDGTAHLIHATYDGINVKIYVDGKRLLKTAETRAMLTGTSSINIGFTLAGTHAAIATLDEAGMLNRALTPKEIRDEYQTWSNQLNELLVDKDRGDRVKIWYGVRMPSAGTDGTTWAEWPQIVAMLPTVKRSYGQTGTVDAITCQDQTRVLADDKFTARTTLASGANYVSGTNGIIAIAQSAGFDTSAWSVTSTALTAPADVDFEIGSSKLDAIAYLLLAINYRPIRFAGDGSAIIEPAVLDKDRTVVDTLVTGTTGVISAENLDVEIEQRSIVNAVAVFNGNPDVNPILATATNDNTGSPTSTVYLPTQTAIVQVDSPDLTTATALAGQILSDTTIRYAKRIRLQTLPRPFHDDRDRLTLTIPELSVNADYVEDEWVLPLSPTELMSHSVLSVVDVS